MLKLTAIVGNDGCPPEPDWDQLFADKLDIAFAHKQWGIITREMHDSTILAVSNWHAIKRLIEFGVQYERASRHVAAHGAILPAVKAKIGQHNPYWSTMNHASEAIKTLEAELGIAPTRRAKAVKLVTEKKTERASDRYLKPLSR